MTEHIAFKSVDAKNLVIAAYEEILNNWPVSHKSQTVKTSFGGTHVVIFGDEKAPPLVLLHGGGGNAAMWISNAAFLSQHFRVYAIDTIGETGKSAEVRPPLNSNGYAHWLDETLSELGLTKPPLAGLSMGGWLAHQYALTYPENISKIVMIAPPALLSISYSFLFRAVMARFFSTDYMIQSFLKHLSIKLRSKGPDHFKTPILNWRSAKPHDKLMDPATDEQISQLPAQTLIILASDEVLYDSRRAEERVRRLAPHVTIMTMPESGHIINLDQPERLNQALVSYLETPLSAETKSSDALHNAGSPAEYSL